MVGGTVLAGGYLLSIFGGVVDYEFVGNATKCINECRCMVTKTIALPVKHRTPKEVSFKAIAEQIFFTEFNLHDDSVRQNCFRCMYIEQFLG